MSALFKSTRPTNGSTLAPEGLHARLRSVGLSKTAI